MSYCAKASVFVLITSGFLSSATTMAAECTQPAVIEAKLLTSSAAFVTARDQAFNPNAARVALQMALDINKETINNSIDQQIGYIQCLGGISKQKLLVASIAGDGSILLRHRMLAKPESAVALDI